MNATSPVIVPTLRGTTRGCLSRVAGASVGALLVDGTSAGRATTECIYADLTLYLAAAGVSVLHLAGGREGHQGRGMDDAAMPVRAADVLAGIALLRESGAERVVLVIASDAALLPQDVTARTLLAGFMDAVAAAELSSYDYARACAELAAAIRIACDTIADVIHLRPVQDTHASQRRVLALPAVADVATLAPLVSRLYCVVTRPLGIGAPRSARTDSEFRPTPHVRIRRAAVRAVDVPTGGSARAREALYARWDALLVGFAARSPERAEAARLRVARMDDAVPPAPSRYAAAWGLLDEAARAEWLACWSAVISGMIAQPQRAG